MKGNNTMNNIYMGYLTESDKELLIMEKECEIEILDDEIMEITEASLYVKGYHNDVNKAKARYKELTKSAKKNIKKGKYNEAERDVKEAKEILVKVRDNIKNEKPGLVSDALDYAIMALPLFIAQTITVYLTGSKVLVKKAFKIPKYITAAKTSIAIIKEKQKEYRKNGKLSDIKTEDLNILRMTSIDSLNNAIKICDDLLELIKDKKRTEHVELIEVEV